MQRCRARVALRAGRRRGESGPATPAGRARWGDRGDIVIGWLLRLALVLGMLGVLAYDTLAVGVAAVTVPDHAVYAARAASEEWYRSRDIRRAYAAAVDKAEEQNSGNRVDPVSFRIDPNGTAHVRIERTVRTIVVSRVHAVRQWAIVADEGSGRHVT